MSGPLRLPTSPGTRSLRPRSGRVSLGAAGEGLVDLSVGTPVDPTPAVVQRGAGGGRRRAGYPLT